MDFLQRKQMESERLPQPKGYQKHTFNVLSRIMTLLLIRIIPSPSEYGWRDEAGGFSPVMTTMDPAPGVILKLVKCCCT